MPNISDFWRKKVKFGLYFKLIKISEKNMAAKISEGKKTLYIILYHIVFRSEARRSKTKKLFFFGPFCEQLIRPWFQIHTPCGAEVEWLRQKQSQIQLLDILQRNYACLSNQLEPTYYCSLKCIHDYQFRNKDSFSFKYGPNGWLNPENRLFFYLADFFEIFRDKSLLPKYARKI